MDMYSGNPPPLLPCHFDPLVSSLLSHSDTLTPLLSPHAPARLLATFKSCVVLVSGAEHTNTYTHSLCSTLSLALARARSFSISLSLSRACALSLSFSLRLSLFLSLSLSLSLSISPFHPLPPLLSLSLSLSRALSLFPFLSFSLFLSLSFTTYTHTLSLSAHTRTHNLSLSRTHTNLATRTCRKWAKELCGGHGSGACILGPFAACCPVSLFSHDYVSFHMFRSLFTCIGLFSHV